MMNSILKKLNLLILALLANTLNAAPVDDALAAYKQKQYHRAAYAILNSQTNLDELSITNKLKMAIIFLNNAKIHKDIAGKAKDIQLGFLESLLSEQGKDKSIFIHLYLAELYIHMGQLNKAKLQLEKFISEPGVSDNFKQLAMVFQAWVLLKQGDKAEFNKQTSALANKHMTIDLAITFIKLQENLVTSNVDSLKNTINKMFIVDNTAMTSRIGNYALGLFVASKSLENARAIYNRLPIHAPSHIEKVTATKIINFYEPTLADSLHNFYKAYAKYLLEQIKNDKKYGDIASFYLSEILLVENDQKLAASYAKKLLNLRLLPKSISPLKEIRASTHGFLHGKRSRAYQVWEEAVNNDKNDPLLSADAILMCFYVNGNCPTLMQKAQLAAENGQSKRFEKLSTNVGRYYLAKDLDKKALRLLEHALDRSNMNSLLANEPILLLNLAEAYRRNKKYSTSLQIYFSLGQNFPIMRQIQDAVQGEYLFQQRSSGQSNVF